MHAASVARAICAEGGSVEKKIAPANREPSAIMHKPANSQRDFFCADGPVGEVFRMSLPVVHYLSSHSMLA